jgi:hypothetical protein
MDPVYTARRIETLVRSLVECVEDPNNNFDLLPLPPLLGINHYSLASRGILSTVAANF